ncbi:MAG: RagB/SusD family nutrient uptake outer membrane protein, partial [Bacteroidota bacterium]|nr:RagB/SusD family nutrient uptake outer membrane protein [Bacteroidota bacterium]
NQCNTLIEYASLARKSDESFTSDMLVQYQAEAVAIRSLMYFYLVRTFRDVPFIAQAIVSDDQNLQIAKTSGTVILDSLIYDLESVAGKMATRFGDDPAVNKGRFTAYGVYSLLADIYLWKEDYAGCIRNCDKVIGSGQISLLYADGSNLVETETNNAITGKLDTVYYLSEGEADEFYKKMYYDGNSDESIFELQRESDFPNGDYYDMFCSNAWFSPRTDVIKDNFFISSEVDNSWYDMRSEGVSYKGSYIWKYIGTARQGSAQSLMRTRETMTGNTIVYRLADVMLMKAEALVQQAKAVENDSASVASGYVKQKLGEAWDIVKKIRLRSNATETTDLCNGITDASGLSASTMEKFVYEERGRELMFEGKRWFDALRHAKRNNYEGNNLNYLTNVAMYSASAAKVSNLQAKFKNKDFHYLPINQSEISANKKLVQNPFYN